jgi:hypothetical protein
MLGKVVHTCNPRIDRKMAVEAALSKKCAMPEFKQQKAIGHLYAPVGSPAHPGANHRVKFTCPPETEDGFLLAQSTRN